MTRRDITKLFKRFFMTFFCCVPIFLGIGFLLNGKIQPWIMTAIFVVIGGGVLAIEEYVHYKRVQKREQIKQDLQNQKELNRVQTSVEDNKNKKSKKSNNKK